MKKLICFLLVLFCIGFLIGCGKTPSVEKLTEAIRSEGIQVTQTGSAQVIVLSSEDAKTIASFLERGEWINDIPKCPYDYQLTTGEYTFYYHSHGCFVFDGRWLSVDDISQKGFNLMFETYEVEPIDSNSNSTLPEQTSGSDTQNDVAISVTDIATTNLNMLTLKDLVERNGENLTWADFASYYSEDVGSGLYILRYPVGMDYSLLIGGGSTEEPPMYIRLVSEYDTEKYIDVRTDSIDDFVNNAPKTADFSYEEVLKTYKENEPGVKYSGFKNTSRVAIERIDDVIEQSKNECTIKYDTVDISHDSTAYIWAITFSTGTPGGCQTVYMDRYGVTCLVVYGE